MAALTVFFDAPFWVCVLEVDDGELVRATRHVFGAEPTDPELYEFLRRNGMALLDAAYAAPNGQPHSAKPDAKPSAKLKSEVRGPSSAAQEAMRLDLETRKRAAKVRTRDRRAAEADQRRDKAKAKARAKHRGH